MSTPDDSQKAARRAEVDKQDGGPGSHTEDASGGETNDVASGGIPEHRNESDNVSDDEDDPGHDVHGDPDSVS